MAARGGLSEEELQTMWELVSHGAKSTKRDLAIFAMGVECGDSYMRRWQVIKSNDKGILVCETRQEAEDYVTMNDTDGDWTVEPYLEFVTYTTL